MNAVDRKRQKQTDWKFVSQAQGRPTGAKDNKNAQQSSLVNNMSLINISIQLIFNIYDSSFLKNNFQVKNMTMYIARIKQKMFTNLTLLTYKPFKDFVKRLQTRTHRLGCATIRRCQRTSALISQATSLLPPDIYPLLTLLVSLLQFLGTMAERRHALAWKRTPRKFAGTLK